MEVLPRLFQVKFDDGLQEETLFIGNAQELPSAVGALPPVLEQRICARACWPCATYLLWPPPPYFSAALQPAAACPQHDLLRSCTAAWPAHVCGAAA